ncbi:MAG: LemA family protein [Calditrichaeota bacterium]|nr:MAG: LemA family protein [Calditrichota bacterium]
MSTLVILGLIFVVGAVFVTIYNSLVKLRTTAESSWSDIDVQLKKRYDLVPSLVETVKGYAKHESSVFEKVTLARSAAMGAVTPAEAAKQENIFKDTLKSLFAVAEAYPELKANTNFVQLQSQFQQLEDDIENARRYYNAVVRDYNIKTETFPSVIVANMFSFKKREFFELDSTDERKPIKPDFS